MMEGFKKAIKAMTGSSKQERIDTISQELEAAQRSLAEHRNNLGIPAEGLERIPDDGGVTSRKKARIAELRKELEMAMKEAT